MKRPHCLELTAGLPRGSKPIAGRKRRRSVLYLGNPGPLPVGQSCLQWQDKCQCWQKRVFSLLEPYRHIAVVLGDSFSPRDCWAMLSGICLCSAPVPGFHVSSEVCLTFAKDRLKMEEKCKNKGTSKSQPGTA